MAYNGPSSWKLSFKRNIAQQNITNLTTPEESIFKPCQNGKKKKKKVRMPQVKNRKARYLP